MDGKIIYTGGTFDLFHAGHVNFLKQCRRIAGKDGKVIVALNPDNFVQTFKGKYPVYNYDQRRIILESCIYVDQVISNLGGSDSRGTILTVKPDFIVIGSDWAQKDYYKQMRFTQSWLDNNNIGLIYVPYTENISSSVIRERLNRERFND